MQDVLFATIFHFQYLNAVIIKKRRNTMPPFPQDSDDDPEEMFVSNDDDGDLQYDEGDMENAIILDDNDAPGEEAKFLLILL